jgi:hypothetical protein
MEGRCYLAGAVLVGPRPAIKRERLVVWCRGVMIGGACMPSWSERSSRSLKNHHVLGRTTSSARVEGSSRSDPAGVRIRQRVGGHGGT